MSVLGNVNDITRYWEEVHVSNQARLPYSVGVASQAAADAQNAWNKAQNQALRVSPQPMYVANVAFEKVQEQVRALVRELPMSIAGSINACGYYEKDEKEAARFVIVLSNNRVLTFYDVDNFPSGEHIGRIALECP